MGHLEGNFTPVFYIGRKVPKGSTGPRPHKLNPNSAVTVHLSADQKSTTPGMSCERPFGSRFLRGFTRSHSECSVVSQYPSGTTCFSCNAPSPNFKIPAPSTALTTSFNFFTKHTQTLAIFPSPPFPLLQTHRRSVSITSHSSHISSLPSQAEELHYVCESVEKKVTTIHYLSFIVTPDYRLYAVKLTDSV